MRYVLPALIASLLLSGSVLCAEDAATERSQGIDALKSSQSNPAAIVSAARHFAKASELYVKAGDENKATEMNSFLFWCKKKMSYQDIEQFTKGGETAVVEKLYMTEKIKPEADESQAWLDRAEKFSAENPAEHFLIAVRFFEVASRFLGSKASITAQERSLKEQALALEKAPAAKAPDPDKAAPPVKTPAAEKTTVVDAGISADSPDPIKKHVGVAKKLYAAEVESAHKSVVDALDKREADARKTGNKKTVDQVKDERAAFEAKSLSDRLNLYSPEHRHKIASAWKTLAAEYESAIKEFTKAAKDADADAVEKEFKIAANDNVAAAFVPTGKVEPESTAGVFRDKTFVVWLTMPTIKTDWSCVMSLEAPAYHYDGIAIGEVLMGKWMAVSDSNQRTELDQRACALENVGPGGAVQIAVSYLDKQVTIYRNGKKYSQYQMGTEPWKFGPDSYALFGVRSLLSSIDYFAGTIHDMRIYSEALTEAQIAALAPHVASGPKPWAWWTFEDGTCRDKMGRFLPGKAYNGVSIKGGVMVLNGKGYFRADQPASVPKKK